MTNSTVRSLFVLHVEANTEYAIAPIERLFFENAMVLARGDVALTHFAYPGFSRGHPGTLPADHPNIFAYDFADDSPANVRWLADYVRRHEIELVVFFDIRPTHPLFAQLRRSGARAIIGYWGAPMSSLMPAWKLVLKRLQMAISPSRLDSLIFESHAMADTATLGRGVPEAMIDIVYQGVDTQVYRPATNDHVRRIFGIPSDRKIVVYAGHMEERKGVPTLVEAMIELLARRRRMDVQFLLFGNKGAESEPYARRYAGLGIQDRIVFGGYRADLAACFPSCDIGVVPTSGWDSFPRSPIEMAACGLPLAAARIGGVPELVRDEDTGLLFTPGDAVGLADTIERLLDDEVLRTTLGRNARAFCERNLTLGQQRQNLLRVFTQRLGMATEETGI